jgi:hypothetical protein
MIDMTPAVISDTITQHIMRVCVYCHCNACFSYQWVRGWIPCLSTFFFCLLPYHIVFYFVVFPLLSYISIPYLYLSSWHVLPLKYLIHLPLCFSLFISAIPLTSNTAIHQLLNFTTSCMTSLPSLSATKCDANCR